MKTEKNNHTWKEENNALQMLKKPAHWGVADSSENIDKYVYRSS